MFFSFLFPWFPFLWQWLSNNHFLKTSLVFPMARPHSIIAFGQRSLSTFSRYQTALHLLLTQARLSHVGIINCSNLHRTLHGRARPCTAAADLIIIKPLKVNDNLASCSNLYPFQLCVKSENRSRLWQHAFVWVIRVAYPGDDFENICPRFWQESALAWGCEKWGNRIGNIAQRWCSWDYMRNRGGEKMRVPIITMRICSSCLIRSVTLKLFNAI